MLGIRIVTAPDQSLIEKKLLVLANMKKEYDSKELKEERIRTEQRKKLINMGGKTDLNLTKVDLIKDREKYILDFDNNE